MRNLKVWLILAFVFFSSTVFSTDTAGLTATGRIRSADEGFAAEEFRRGVQAYYRGLFNEAVMQFEKALSYKSDDNLILDWLGKAYYKSGMEGEALSSWERASQNGYGGILLQNRIEVVSERRVIGSAYETDVRYTEAGSFPGVNGNNLIFSGPVSVLPNSDGSAWVVAYGSNELLRINVNGTVVNRSQGPITGFDRPVDLIRLQDGNLLVSESAGDRLSLLSENGKFIKHIGEKGRGVGQCIGPQYLCQDFNGNIYVTDFGNCRVDVFDSDGNGLFHFGSKQEGFPGFLGPTGIAVINDNVYVADFVYGAIYQFDLAGNFERVLVREKTFSKPESMKMWGNYLVICDSNKVFSIDIDTGSIYESANTGNSPSRLTSAVPDINGNVLVTDLKSNEVYVMAKMQELVGGLFVQIEKINSDNFPNVIVELRVENRHRQSVVGLREENFYLTENKRPVSGQRMLGSASNNKVEDITIVIDRAVSSASYSSHIQNAVREIASGMNGEGTLRIVSASNIPVQEYVGSPKEAERFSMNVLHGKLSSDISLDLAFRLAANELINAERKRAIVFVTDGTLTQNAFSKYGVAEIASYLNNNSIAFSNVIVSKESLDPELEYLSKATLGESYYVYRKEGLQIIPTELCALPSGLYQFSYISSLNTNMGEAFLPLEAEVYLLNRSGRDEAGYFAPLQ
ncbi:MAG: hypothetical protein IKI31_03120 [Treponema sp.]|nr:hypothetical protein [Treponema sp.]